MVTRRRNLPKLRLQSGRQGIRGVLKSTGTALVRSQWAGFVEFGAT